MTRNAPQPSSRGGNFAADDTINAGQPAGPNPALGSLDRLVGAWNVSGPEIRGRVIFEWIEGGFFPYGNGVALSEEVPGTRLLSVEKMGHELPPAAWNAVVPAILRHTSGGRRRRDALS